MDKKCTHCGQLVSTSTHNCPKKGLLNVDEDSSFLVSAAIGALTDNAIIGGLAGGDILGGIVGDLLSDGGLF